MTDRAPAPEDPDITARRLAAIVDSSDDAIVSKDLHGIISSWNAGAERIFGYTAEEMIGASILKLIPPELQSEEVEIVSRLQKGERIDHFETIRRAKDGRLLNISLSVSPIRDSSGKVIGASKIARNITEQKEAAASLRASEEKFQQLWASTTDAIIIIDEERRVLYANPSVYDTFGFTPEDLLGGGLDLVMPERIQSGYLKDIRQHLAGETLSLNWRGRESVALHRDGYEFPVEISLSHFKDNGRDLFAAIIRDIRARKQTEAALTRASEEARQAWMEAEKTSRMKDEFLATLSHELRTPLNAILGWAAVLRQSKPGGEDLERGLATIERNAKAQAQIIADLLDMSRIISGKVRLDVQSVDLPVVLGEALETVRAAADAKGISIQSVIDPHASPVSGDPNRLQQVLWNLLSNAIKFSSKGGRIQVTLARVDSHAEISVTDSGEGIDPEFLPYVFDRFQQADGSASRKHGGLGLGLAIVKQLIGLHGGSAHARSAGPGAGSTFAIHLPLKVVHPDPQTPGRHPSSGSVMSGTIPDISLQGVKVLVVDDENDARTLVKRLLEISGATVTTAGSAEEAMGSFLSEKPDVLICDIGMPEEDGYSFIHRLRGIDARLPALALTAYARPEDRTRAIRAGFDNHLAKPVDAGELLAVVERMGGLSGQA